MSRRTILVIALILALLAAVVPLASVALFARHSATQYKKRHLQEYAGWTLRRTERSLDHVRNAIRQLEHQRLSDCSPAHIAKMRRLMLVTPSVKEIGYFIDGKLACTGWGQAHSPP